MFLSPLIALYRDASGTITRGFLLFGVIACFCSSPVFSWPVVHHRRNRTMQVFFTMQRDQEISKSSARRPGRIFYGWWVITAVSALYALASGTYWSGFSFYFLPITRDLSLSRTSMSLALGLARLVGGLQGPIAGYLVDRLGPRFMIFFGGVLGGVQGNRVLLTF